MQMRNIHSVWNNTRSKIKSQGTTRFEYTPCDELKRRVERKNAIVWYTDDIHGPCIGTVYEKNMITRWHNTDRVLLKTRHVETSEDHTVKHTDRVSSMEEPCLTLYKIRTLHGQKARPCATWYEACMDFQNDTRPWHTPCVPGVPNMKRFV